MRTTVDGLERFLTRMWKGLQCDKCGKNYTGILRETNARLIYQAAIEDGWSCGEQDICPNCAIQENTQ